MIDPNLKKFLEESGYLGQVQEAGRKYLTDFNYSGQWNEAWREYLNDRGFSGPLAEATGKARALDYFTDNKASDPNPGTKSGAGSIITGLSGPLVVGGIYETVVVVSNISGASDVFYPAATGPFPFQNVNLSEGVNILQATAEDSDVTSALRLGAGDPITIDYVSIRRVLA